MTFADELGRIGSTMVWGCRITLDQCTLTYGNAPCTASGTPYCYYTYPTCKDPSNYDLGSKIRYFVSDFGFKAGSPYMPLIKDIKITPAEVDFENNVTRRSTAQVILWEDGPLPLANPDKTVTNAETGGKYFRNMKARSPNYEDRLIEIYMGAMTSSGYVWADKPIFRGIITDWKGDDGNGTATIEAKDFQAKLDEKIPAAISSTNVLTAAYTGGATMYVTNGDEFEIPCPDHPSVVKLSDVEEYVTYTGVSGDTLTGCVPARFGSTAFSPHPIGTQLKQVIVYSDAADFGVGLAPDYIIYDLICNYGGVPAEYLATKDLGITADGAIGSGDVSITLSEITPIPETGLLKIDDEIIYYTGKSVMDVTPCQRAMFGTTAAAHSNGASVLVLRGTDEAGFAIAGMTYRRKLESAKKVNDWLNDLRGSTLMEVFPNEDGELDVRAWRPPRSDESVMTLTDTGNVIKGSYQDNDKKRVTACIVHYDLKDAEGSGSTDEKDYLKHDGYIYADMESAPWYGKRRLKEVFANWIFASAEAHQLATHYTLMFANKPSTFSLDLSRKDHGLRMMDYANATIRENTGADGALPEVSMVIVIAKKIKSLGQFTITAMKRALNKKYPVIAPASLSGAWDTWTDEQKRIYGAVGSAGDWPTGNKVGVAATEDGYYIW